MDYYYKGAKVSIWGKNGNKCTIVVEDEETADRISGFLRHDESYLTWFYKTVNVDEVENVEAPTTTAKVEESTNSNDIRLTGDDI